MKNGTKKWKVVYSHDDGRSGTVEAVTELQKDESIMYGNKTYGSLSVNNERVNVYDLRYSRGDLHRIMLEEYFGQGLVEATEL